MEGGLAAASQRQPLLQASKTSCLVPLQVTLCCSWVRHSDTP